MDKAGIVHVPVAKVSFSASQISENAQAVKKAGEGLGHFKAQFLDKKRALQFAELQKQNHHH